MSLKTRRFVFGHGVTHARITPVTTRIVPSGLMMFLIPVTEYILRSIYYLWWHDVVMYIIHTGGIGTGLLSDIVNARAFSCIISLVLAVPSVSIEIHK